jgi:hypothetical protein
MDKKLAVVALACAFLTSGVARAQWLGPAWETTTELTAQDLDLIRTTVQRDIHGKRADTVASWNNPASGNSGTITLLKKFTRHGKPCEQIEYRIKSPQPAVRPERYVFTSCLQPDRSWKLES